MNGSYVITIPPHCILSTDVWSLHGLVTHQIGVWNQTYFRPEPIDLKWLSKSWPAEPVPRYIPPGEEKFEIPSYDALDMVVDSDLYKRVTAGLDGMPWWAFSLIVFVLFLVLGIVIYIVYRGQPCVLCDTCRRCCRRLCRGTERAPVEHSSQVPHAPHFHDVSSLEAEPISARARAATFPRTRPMTGNPETVPMDILVPTSTLVSGADEVSSSGPGVSPDAGAGVQNPQYVRLPWICSCRPDTPHPRRRYAVNLDAPVNTDGSLGEVGSLANVSGESEGAFVEEESPV